MGRVSVACEQIERELPALIAAKVRQNLASAFPNSYGVEVHAGDGEVTTSGQWAEAAEFGTVPHEIAPNEPGYALEGGGPRQHSPDNFGPIMPDASELEASDSGGRPVIPEDVWGPSVSHPGTRASHALENAGDSAYTLGSAMLVEYLP